MITTDPEQAPDSPTLPSSACTLCSNQPTHPIPSHPSQHLTTQSHIYQRGGDYCLEGASTEVLGSIRPCWALHVWRGREVGKM